MGVLGCSTSAPPLVHFAPKTARIPLKTPESKEEYSESLRKLVQDNCPSLFTPFEPKWWLNNGHIQTTYSVFADISQVDSVWYRRQNLKLVDGGTLTEWRTARGLDFAPIDDAALSDDTPIVVILHGLTGGSYEPYIKSILTHAIKPVDKGGLGYRAVIPHSRGCGGVPITSTKFYSAGGTDDFRQALIYISNRYPRAKLLGLGFSLGSNIMTRYIAQEGEKCRLSSACVLANPWDLAANSDILSGTFIGRNVYNNALGTNLMNVAKQHYKALMADPSLPIAKALKPLMSVSQMTLTNFDKVFLSQVGGPPPQFPYATVNEYYDAMSSHECIGEIRIPYLAINSADDPVVQYVPMDGAGNGYAVMVLTSGGGHLGWFNDGTGKDRWTTKPVLEWLTLMGREVLAKSGSERGHKVVLGTDEFLRNEGGDEWLGCKECEGGGLINGNAGVEGLRKGL
ncbi:Alpha/Beta hydrolase protein [Lentinula detonsa]|uniref:Alpha/Beta hydrolase protein n=1 Tax=Lentinula detonsa TaxID=2804962 RepID=A0A9W8P0Z5_9AGAR|nr:Alpha/Beta hydrolase protein [Lentinula detonsa]